MSNDKVSREIVLHLVAMSSSYNVFIKRTRVLLAKSIFMIFDVPLFLESFFFLMKTINQRRLMDICCKNVVNDLKSKMPEFPQLES